MNENLHVIQSASASKQGTDHDSFRRLVPEEAFVTVCLKCDEAETKML